MPTIKPKEDDISLETEESEHDLYGDLGLSKDCDPKAIKKAYFKVALQYHPDKLSEDLGEEEKAAAKAKFQAAGLAYSVLSDPTKKERYDRTGSWEELELEFSTYEEWNSYFRAQFGEKVTISSIEKLKKEYQGSAEEKKDVIESYNNCSGHMGKILDSVILSSTKDEDRFMGYIDEAIKNGEVKRLPAYTKSMTFKARQLRIRNEEKEAEEAEAASKELEKDSNCEKSQASPHKKKSKTGKDSSLENLAQLIQARNAERESNSDAFFERLASRYSRTQKGADSKGKRKKMKVEDSIPEA